VVFRAGAEADSLHLVEPGCFSVRRDSPGGHAALLSLVGTGGFFGELALLGPSERSATVAAVETSTTPAVSRVAFNELRDRRPSIDRALAAFLGAQVRHLLGQLVDAMYSPVETRIRARLIEASEQWGPAVLLLTQQDVAELAGTTRPTANRVLHQLADEGLVVLHRSETVIADADADGMRRRERGW